MNFLPIATRELQVASRRKATYRIRLWTAVVGIVVLFALLLVFKLIPNGISGKQAFAILSNYAVGLCLIAGAFLTADSLSEEKREGTLGLLFLTDLKGYDVVLGKLVAGSLNAFYGLLALFPVLALPLLLGGVTGTEFWRTMVALINALFFSLSLGIWISARLRDSDKILGGVISSLLFFCGALPLLNKAVDSAGPTNILWILSSCSPYLPFHYASTFGTGNARFFTSLAASHVVPWVFVIWASLILPKRWQDRPKKAAASPPTLSPGLQTIRKPVSRGKLLDENPVFWLMSRESRLGFLAWVIATVAFVVALGTSYLGGNAQGMFSLGIMTGILFVFKALIAVRATRFFSESRRSGAFELLLSTPLSTKDIMRGQWLALRRIFFWPAVICLLCLFNPGGLVAVLNSERNFGEWAMTAALGGYAALSFGVSLLAIIWFGMWMGLTCKKPNYATTLTLLFTVVLPSVAFCVPNFIASIALFAWARGKLKQDFRAVVANQLQGRAALRKQPIA